MWKPAEKILYEAQPGRWPSADEAARALLFQALSAGRLQLASRTWVPAMVPWRATEEGDATDDVVAWYRRCGSTAPVDTCSVSAGSSHTSPTGRRIARIRPSATGRLQAVN